MLVTIALFALVILMSQTKPALQANQNTNSTTQAQSSEWPSIPTDDISTYNIPLDSVIHLPLASRVSFKVSAVSGKILVGNVVESGGGCFTFFVLDEDAYLFLLRNGPGLLSRSKGEVYVSEMPAHYRTAFTINTDRTGDYYFVFINPAGSCHGKTVSIKLNG